jgi:hypothetical protein
MASETLLEARERSTMAGFALNPEISSILPMGTSVQARWGAQVAHDSRGRGAESGAGSQPGG